MNSSSSAAVTCEVIRLGEMPLGGRLVVRSKKDWRFAVISRVEEGRITLCVTSPSGRNYRMWRPPDCLILVDGKVPCLKTDYEDRWRDNLSFCERRW